MKITFLAAILILSLLTSSCDKIRSKRNQVRDKILSPFKNEESQIPQSPPPTPIEPTKDLNSSKRIVEDGPKEKLLNLNRAFVLNPDKTFQGLLINEIKKSGKLFGEKLDDGLKSQLLNFVPLFESRKNISYEVMKEWSQNLAGENKKIAQSIYATLFDHDPSAFIQHQMKYFSGDNCQMIRLLPIKKNKEEMVAFLGERFNKVEGLFYSEIDRKVQDFWQTCAKQLKEFVEKLEGPKTPTPSVQATPDSSSLPIQN